MNDDDQKELLTARDEVKLHPAQQRAVDKAASVRGPVWLQGDMGTGKTFTAICICEGVEMGLVCVHERALGEQWVASLEDLGYKAVFVSRKEDLLLLDVAAEDDDIKWIVTTYGAIKRKERVKLTPEAEAAFRKRLASVKAHNKVEGNRRLPVPKWPKKLSAVSKELKKALVGKVDKLICDESQSLNALHKSKPSQRAKAMKDFVEKNFEPQRADPSRRDRLKMLFLSGTPVTGRDTDLIGQYDIARLLPTIERLVKFETIKRQFGEKEVEMRKPVGWKEDYEFDPPGIAETLEKRRVRLSRKEMFAKVPPMTNHGWAFDIGSEEDLLAAMIRDEAKDEDSPELEAVRHDMFRHAVVENESGSQESIVRQMWWKEFFRLADEFAAQMRKDRTTIEKMTGETMPMYLFNCLLRSSMKLLLPQAGKKIVELAKTGKTIVFAEHFRPLAELAKGLPEDLPWGYYVGAGNPDLDGKRLTEKRIKENKNNFRFGDLQLLLATYGKGGVGVEFTPAPNVVLAGRTARVDQMRQAEARIYRFNTRVPTHSFTCYGTINGELTRIEQSLSRIIEEKRARAARVGLGGTLG